MDFHALPRRDLQALCKRNRIPANMTNVAMADALRALQTVEGIDEFQQSVAFLSPKKTEVPSPALPATGRRTSARRGVIKDDALASAPARAGRGGGKASAIKKVVVFEREEEGKREGEEEMPEVPLDKGSPLPRSRRVMARASAVKSVVIGGEEDGIEKIPETPAVTAGRRTRAAGTRRGEGKKEEKEGREGGVEVEDTPDARRKASVARNVVVDPVVEGEEKEEGEVVSVRRSTRRATRQSSRKQLEEVLGSGLVIARRSTRARAAVKIAAMAQEEEGKEAMKNRNGSDLSPRGLSAEVEESCITLNPEMAHEDDKGEGDHEVQSNFPHQVDREIAVQKNDSTHLLEVDNPEAENEESDDKHEILPLENNLKAKDGQDDQREKGELEAQHQVQEEKELLEKAEGSNVVFDSTVDSGIGGEQDKDWSLESTDISLFKTEAEEYMDEPEEKISNWDTEVPNGDHVMPQLETIVSTVVEDNVEHEDEGSKQGEKGSEVCESDDSPIKVLVVTSEHIADEDGNAVHNHELVSVESSANIAFKGNDDQIIEEMEALDETFGVDTSSKHLLTNLDPATEDSSEPEESGLEIGADAAAAQLSVDISVSTYQTSSEPESVTSSNQLVIDNKVEQTIKEMEPSYEIFGEDVEDPARAAEDLSETESGLEIGADAVAQLSVDVVVSADQTSPRPEALRSNQLVIDNKAEQTIKEMEPSDETFGDDVENSSKHLLANLDPAAKDSLEPESGLEVGAVAATQLSVDTALCLDQVSSGPESLSSNQVEVDNKVKQTVNAFGNDLTVELIAESLMSLNVNGCDVAEQSLDVTTAVAVTKNLVGNATDSGFVSGFQSDALVSETKEEGTEKEESASDDKENKTVNVKAKKIDLERMSLTKLRSLYKEKLDSKKNDKVEVKRPALTALDDNCL